MVVGITKLPILVDLTHGTIGMWAGFDSTSQDGMVVPKYFPHNSMRLIKPNRANFLVPREAIIGPFQPSGIDQEGIPREIVILTESDKGSPVMDYMDEEIEKNIQKIKSRLQDKDFQVSQERRKRRESEDDIEQEKRDKQSRGRRSRPSSDGPSFRNRGN